MAKQKQTSRPAPSAPAPDAVVLGRYRLVDKVGEGTGGALWRGQDDRLNRPVSVRFVPLDDPRSGDLRRAALRASQVTDRRAVHVLDAANDDASGCLVIVTEWLEGTTYAEQLLERHGEPVPERRATALALEVARTLQAAAADGVTHGHLDPDLLMVTADGDVRVRGLGVEQVLCGVDPGDDPALADIHAVGAVLYSGLTGRWPGPGSVEGLPLVPTLRGGTTPWPSRVVAEVPRHLDVIAARALRTTDAPRPEGRYESMDELVADLSAALVVPAAPLPAPRRRTRVRVGSVVAAVACALGLAYLGLQMALGLGGSPLTVPRAAVAPVPSTASPSIAAPVSSASGDSVIPVVSATDFDPYGNDKHENPQLAPLAIDANPATAWTTVHYKSADLSGKPGVGLLLDLGAPRPVSAVALRLVGNGTDLSVLATENPNAKVETFTSLAQVTGAGSSVTLRVPSPVTTRYLVIWLTAIPSADGSFQGGVADVQVLG